MLALGLAALIFLPNLPFTASASPADPPTDNDNFIIYQGANGDTVCREATPFEAGQLNKIKPTDLRPINHLDLNSKSGVRTEDLPAHLTIILRATANLDANAPAKAAFVRAAAAWENVITSPVTIYIDADVGPDNFGQAWGSGVLGATSSPSLGSISYTALRQTLIGIANTPAKQATYNALPASSVPVDTAAGSASTVSVSASIARAIGLLDPTAQSTESAARIGFNSAVNFDYDSSNGVTGTDFQSVATHEIGHALGFSSRSGSGSSTPSVWDLYRFRSGTTAATFSTAQRIMTVGGPTSNSQYYFFPGATELGLSDGGPSGSTDNNADGNQSSHWRQASLNGGTFAGYIGIMDPRLPSNTIRPITQNDTDALNIFGYNSNLVTPTPPPNDNFASAQIISGCSGTVTGTNVGATSEPNEPNHSPDNGGGHRSVWYQWLAPSSVQTTITTAGSGFDTVLGVYEGTTLAGLVALGKADDNSTSDKTSTVTFSAIAGHTYRIAVDGYNNSALGGDVGPVTLNWSASNCSVLVPQIMLDQTGPAADQASAVDSINWLRDPFFVVNPGNLINPAADPNTRVVILVSTLPAGSIVVNLVDSNNQSYDIPAQDVRAVPNFDFSQVTFRLPTGLPAGTVRVKVVVQGVSSNTATFRIRT